MIDNWLKDNLLYINDINNIEAPTPVISVVYDFDLWIFPAVIGDFNNLNLVLLLQDQFKSDPPPQAAPYSSLQVSNTYWGLEECPVKTRLEDGDNDESAQWWQRWK
jgi:hypothetical protein